MNQQVANPFESRQSDVVDTASAVALAQREVTEVQSALIIARQYPRDQKKAVDNIINACTRVTLAEQSIYQYVRGGTDVTGPTIRLAEECARSWGNMISGVAELTRGAGMSECMAYAWDLESGYRDEKRFQVRHWRDKRDGGGYALKDERDIYEHVANQGARRKRACILAVIPGDVIEAAIRQCEVTLKTKVEITPELIEKMLAKFVVLGVTKKMIEKRIQRRVDTITPALMLNLGKIYNSLDDGMSKPVDWFEISPEEAPKTSLDELTGNGKKEPEEMPESKTAPTEPEFTAEEVEKLVDRAKNVDQLSDAMDLIPAIPRTEREKVRAKAMEKYRLYTEKSDE